MIQSIYMRRAGQQIQVLFLALVTVLIMQAPAPAEPSSSFFQTIHLAQDGVLDVTERIDIDFADSTRPAIYRVIPVDYRTLDGDYHTEVRMIGVRDQADAPVDFSQSRLGSTLNVRIARPANERGGLHSYILHYIVRRAVCISERAQVCFSATGDAWPMPIREATLNVVLPPNVNPNEVSVRGYLGGNGNQSGAAKSILSEATASISMLRVNNVKPGQELYLLISLPKSAIKEVGVAETVRWFLADWWPAVLIALLTLLGLGAVFWVCGRDSLPLQAISLSPAPPANLSPAEVGALVDERCDMHEISSSLVDLAVRGFIKIEEIQADGFVSLSNKDYLLTGLKAFDDPQLATHERLLLKSIFASANGKTPPVSRLSDLKGKFYEHLSAIKQAVYADLTSKGKFTCSPDEVGKSYYAGGIAIAVVGVVISLALKQSGSLWPAVGNGLVISGLLVLLFAPLMKARTVFGSLALAQAKALERFMLTAAWNGLPDNAGADPATFERLLPYAMVLGVSDKWAEAFHGLLKEPPNWYRPQKASPDFSSEQFVSDLGNGMRTVERILSARDD
ncbi:MAG: hypothetical protein C5B53_03990 [Candidatus Melainabacteria bacterium]|nr:MAG: hypothetical protein C5B53_03990 [Candidatus Melainabacteria bacterium]